MAFEIMLFLDVGCARQAASQAVGLVFQVFGFRFQGLEEEMTSLGVV